MRNAKAKGARSERKSREHLEAEGYRVTRSGGSLGAWDLIAISPSAVLLVQCKSNRPPGRAERLRLAAFPCPPGVSKVIHLWRDWARTPEWIRLPGR
jgi:hypothetical protein